MKQQVSVSVLMTAYNAELYIESAIQSILNQTFIDFELIILDDGATDGTYEKVLTFSDARIKIHKNDGNKGLTYSRNKCLELAQGEYIAWQDADDLATTDRLEKQFSFMEANPDFAMVGGWVQPIDRNGQPKGKIWKYYAKPNEVPTYLFFGNYFAQSAVMIRKSMLPKEWYHPDYPPVEDYELWIRLINEGKCWNLPNVFLFYRIYEESITFKAHQKHVEGLEKIAQRLLIKLGAITDEVSTLNDFLHNRLKSFAEYLRVASRLKDINQTSKTYPLATFNALLLNKLVLNARKNPKALLKLVSSSFLFSFPNWIKLQIRKSAFK